MCKQEQKIWYTAMDDTTPYSGEVEIDTSKKSKKAYGIGHCWKCHNGNGIFWKKTWNGAFPDTCWSCNGTGKGKVRLYTLKQVQGQIKRAEKNHILYLNKVALGNEINSLKNIAYNYSEKGVAQRAKRLAWKKDKILTKNSSENSFLDVEVDTTITVKATIKDHREYQGTKQTVINRPKIIEGVR